MTCVWSFHFLDILKKMGFKIHYDELGMEATPQMVTASRTEHLKERMNEVPRLVKLSATYAKNEMLLVREDADLADL